MALSPQVTGNVGLYYYCYKLSLLGWNVMPTSRNARGIDIIAYSADASRFVGIQVKALSKRNPVPLGPSLDKVMGRLLDHRQQGGVRCAVGVRLDAVGGEGACRLHEERRASVLLAPQATTIRISRNGGIASATKASRAYWPRRDRQTVARSGPEPDQHRLGRADPTQRAGGVHGRTTNVDIWTAIGS